MHKLGLYRYQSKKNALYAVKSASDERTAAFYYYPDMNILSKFKRFTLNYAGHANAMAVDDSNVYICAWTGTYPYPDRTYNNTVLQIPLEVFDNLKSGATIPLATSKKLGITIMEPITPNTNEKTSAKKPYIPFKKAFSSITKYTDNGKFLITMNYSGDIDFGFTTAEVKTIDGKEQFVVSSDPNDMFFVKNTLGYAVTNQDICFTTECGLILPKYCSKQGASYNVIFQADILGDDYSYKEFNGTQYRYYIPDIILVDKTNDTGYSLPKYTGFEVESAAITANNELYVSTNVSYSIAYTAAYKADNSGDTPPENPIFLITHDNGKNFVLGQQSSSDDNDDGNTSFVQIIKNLFSRFSALIKKLFKFIIL